VRRDYGAESSTSDCDLSKEEVGDLSEGKVADAGLNWIESKKTRRRPRKGRVRARARAFSVPCRVSSVRFRPGCPLPGSSFDRNYLAFVLVLATSGAGWSVLVVSLVVYIGGGVVLEFFSFGGLAALQQNRNSSEQNRKRIDAR